MRTSTHSAALKAMQGLHASLLRVLDNARPVTTGKRVELPSDDPVSAARITSLKSQIAREAGFRKAAAEGRERLSLAASALGAGSNALRSAQTAALRGLNSATLGQRERDILAEEVDQALAATLGLANTRAQGRSLFSGFQTSTDAFGTTVAAGRVSAVAYQGDGGTGAVQVGEAVQVRSNLPGDRVWDRPGASALASLIRVRDALLAGDEAALRGGLAELESAQAVLSTAHADAGALMRSMEDRENALEASSLELTALLSAHEDADLALSATRYQQALGAYEAGLLASAKVLELPSLMRYL